jgi:hypothetical protein
MANIKGSIYDVIIINDAVAQIVFRGRDNGKLVLRSYVVVGYWKDKAIKDFKLKAKDKITARYSIESKFVKERNRYYTDIYLKDIKVLYKAPERQKGLLIDEETGEIIP